jgi:hypothetical protein
MEQIHVNVLIFKPLSPELFYNISKVPNTNHLLTQSKTLKNWDAENFSESMPAIILIDTHIFQHIDDELR